MKRSVDRTERGLVVAGTRITLYQLMDYLVAGWTPQLISTRLRLDSDLVADVLAWMDQNRELLEREYAEVVAQNEASRAYWEEKTKSIRAGRRIDKEALRAEIERRYGSRSA